jgi:hypothetical protein
MARRLVARSLVFSRRAFATRFDVLGFGRPFFESLVFTFWIVILQVRTPNIAATRHRLWIGRLDASGVTRQSTAADPGGSP